MREDSCKHYNGYMNKTCKKGVCYDSLAGDSPGILRRLPCLADNTTEIECPHRALPTREELEQFDREMQERVAFMNVAYSSCVKDALANGFDPKAGDGAQGTIECPKCHKTLRYTISGYNGHLWGVCLTPGCLRWME